MEPERRKSYSQEMESERRNKKLMVVQEGLDQLFVECQIPFALTAQNVIEQGPGVYEVRLRDKRIQSFRFSWKDGDSFKEVLRVGVVDRERELAEPVLSFVM
jgi:hypothetical protein